MKKRTVRGWDRIEIEPAKAMELLRGAGVTPTDGDPAYAWAHRDRQGRWRRLHATWADGWRATLTLRLDGGTSLSMALRLTTAPRGVAGNTSGEPVASIGRQNEVS